MEGQDRDLTELPREVWLHPSPGSLVVTIPVR